MLESVATASDCYVGGAIYDVPDAIGASWVRGRHAIISARPPGFIDDLEKRLAIGAGETVLCLPFVGEFGHMILTHIRIVHFSQAKRKIVCCRKGEESLYPTADEFHTEWADPIPDEQRAGTIRPFERPPVEWPAILAKFQGVTPLYAGGLTQAQEHHVLCPDQRIPFNPRPHGRRALKVDVCLGVRVRDFCQERNFPREAWQAIADALTARGLTFGVVGKRPTSFDLDGQRFHTDGNCDAAIEAIGRCALWVGTDTGTTHLASTIGKPIVVFRNDGQEDFIDLMRIKNSPHPVHFLPNTWNPEPIIAAIDAALFAEVKP
jgi:hypothetical protein